MTQKTRAPHPPTEVKAPNEISDPLTNSIPPGDGGGKKTPDLDNPFEVWRWVRDHCDWPMREKMAYWCLYSRRGKDGRPPAPGLRRLAKDMGTTRTAVIQAVKSLQKIGALRVEARKVEGAEEADTNIYHLAAPWKAHGAIERKPRGKHAVPVTDAHPVQEPEVVSKPDHVVTNQDQVVSNQDHVVLKQGDGGPEAGQQVVSKQDQNKPIERANEQAIDHHEEQPPNEVIPGDGQDGLLEEALRQVESYLQGRTRSILLSGTDLEEVGTWVSAAGGDLQAIFAGIEEGLRVHRAEAKNPRALPRTAKFFGGFVDKAIGRAKALNRKEAPTHGSQRASGRRDEIVRTGTAKSRWES